MHVKTVLISVALLAGLPAVALAQTEADRRMFEAQQAARELELRQRLDQVERTVENLELRQRTEENLRDMRAATTVIGPAYPQLPPLTVVPGGTRRPLTQDEVQAAELAASNARLRALTQPPTKK